MVTASLTGLVAPGSDSPSGGPLALEAEALRARLGPVAMLAYLAMESDTGRAHPGAPGRERGCADFGVVAALAASWAVARGLAAGSGGRLTSSLFGGGWAAVAASLSAVRSLVAFHAARAWFLRFQRMRRLAP